MIHKKTGFFRNFHYLCLVAVIALGLITIVGSNGGDDTTTATTTESTTDGDGTGGNGGGEETTTVDLTSIGGTIYNLAQAVGDLAQTAFNPTTLEYGFNVIEGINEGQSYSGTLSLMSGYTQYVYEADGVPVFVFPNNVFIAIPGEGDEGIYVGVPSLTTDYTASEIAGIYNYVQFGGTGGDVTNYEGSYGTFKVDENETWESLEEGDLSTGTADDSGTWEDQGNGIVYAKRDGTKIANVMINPSYAGNTNEKVLILDIHDGDFRGIMLGVKQQSITSGSADGTYALLESDAESIIPVTVSGTTVQTPNGNLPITYNSPWDGFVLGADDTLVLMLPGGIFFGGGGDEDSEWIFAGIETGS
jgi:hypothetical protein